MAKASIGLLVLAAWLTGCATVGTAPHQAIPLPAERLMLKTSVGDAKVTVIRDSGALGSGCYFALWVNRELAARMGVAERVTFDVPSGEVLLGASRDPQGAALCSAAVDTTKVQMETILRPGEHKMFRLAIPQEGGVRVVRADF